MGLEDITVKAINYWNEIEDGVKISYAMGFVGLYCFYHAIKGTYVTMQRNKATTEARRMIKPIEDALREGKIEELVKEDKER